MGWKYIDINWKNELRIYEKRETEIESNVAKEEMLKKNIKGEAKGTARKYLLFTDHSANCLRTYKKSITCFIELKDVFRRVFY